MTGRTCAELLRDGEARLAAAGLDGARQDVRWLLAHALGISSDSLAGRAQDTVDAEASHRFDAFVTRRAAREPISHILGRRAFYGRDFLVTPDVLDPRPETEAIVERVLQAKAPNRLLDLGTGSGALLVSLLAALPEAAGTGTDLSANALQVAQQNAERHAVQDRARFFQSSWFADVSGQFDLIVCNPPYIPEFERDALSPEVREFEPHLALFAGPDGLTAFRQLAADLAQHLAPGGRAIFEFGLGQEQAVARIFESAGHAPGTVVPDITGRARFLEILG